MAGPTRLSGCAHRGPIGGRDLLNWPLPATAASVRAARERVRAALEARGVSHRVREDVALAASEMVTNAVLHTGSAKIVCGLRFSEGRVCLQVSDEGAGGTAPQMRQAGDDEEDGRGLFLVEVISEQWGVLPAVSGSGRTVWASFLTAAPAGAETSG